MCPPPPNPVRRHSEGAGWAWAIVPASKSTGKTLINRLAVSLIRSTSIRTGCFTRYSRFLQDQPSRSEAVFYDNGMMMNMRVRPKAETLANLV
jgi:hypothetical protein